MRADKVDLSTVFGQQVSYRIPRYQRPYVWKEATEWVPLWDDIEAVLQRQIDDTPSNDQIPHFLGAVVFDQVPNQTGMVQARYVIDGQQRLTTLQIFIAAARSVAVEQSLVDTSNTFEMLLFNPEFLVRNAPENRLKVSPSKADRASFVAVSEASNGAAEPSGAHLITNAYRFFRRQIVAWAVEGLTPDETSRRIEILSTVLWKLLLVVAIDLDASDNAQVIFETLNARGTPLLAADLVKNHLFQIANMQGMDIDKLYTENWEPLDEPWWREEVQVGRLKRPRLDVFMNHWLSMSLGREVVAHQLFSEFKRSLVGAESRVVDTLAELAKYAVVYRSFTMQATEFVKEGKGSRVGRFLYRLDTIEATTAYPFLLWLFGPDGIANADERLRSLDAVESWLARRVILRANTQGYSTLFLALLARIRAGDAPSGGDVAAYLRGLEGERGYWPTDDQVRATLLGTPVYQVLLRRRLRMILEAVEDELQERVGAETSGLRRNLTVEHVLPQRWHAHWDPPESGDPASAAELRDVLKHTIGNLLLITGRLNSKQSNRPWLEKQALLNDRSRLHASADVRAAACWNEQAIEERSMRLATTLLKVWPGPTASMWS